MHRLLNLRNALSALWTSTTSMNSKGSRWVPSQQYQECTVIHKCNQSCTHPCTHIHELVNNLLFRLWQVLCIQVWISLLQHLRAVLSCEMAAMLLFACSCKCDKCKVAIGWYYIQTYDATIVRLMVNSPLVKILLIMEASTLHIVLTKTASQTKHCLSDYQISNYIFCHLVK